MKNTFSIGAVYSEGWKLFEKHLGFLTLSTVVSLVVYLVLSRASHVGGVSSILGLASWLVLVIFVIGLVRGSLSIIAGQNPNVHEFETDLKTFLNVIWAGIIGGFFTIIGLILLIIPGIIISLRLSQARVLVVDKKMSGWSAIKESWRITKGHSWSIFGFMMLGLIIFVISIIPFGLGTILSVPYLLLSSVVMYKRILGFSGEEAKETVVVPIPLEKQSESETKTEIQ